MKSTLRRLLLLIIGVTMMVSLFGCGAQKYRLNFDGYGFKSKKTAYAAGEKVTVYYDLIATDTDYHFWLDDDSVQMKQDYDGRHGYIFTFTMPAHDVTLHEESHNSMMYIPRISVLFKNEVEDADIWILPQTEANRKTSLWGTATIGGLGKGEEKEVVLTADYDVEYFMVRIIDEDHAFYSAQDLVLENGYTLAFRSEDSKFDAVIEVLDGTGDVISTQEAFTGVFGAE